ncbi:MAG: hypothetical protein HC812_04475 [Leptolyngbya sp. RL_3_1]|nr:hypothetical protein [Leptolyngbya sp. RL_3_1]
MKSCKGVKTAGQDGMAEKIGWVGHFDVGTENRSDIYHRIKMTRSLSRTGDRTPSWYGQCRQAGGIGDARKPLDTDWESSSLPEVFWSQLY